MKKLISLAIGLGLVLGLTTVTFAQDKMTTKMKSTKAAKAKPTKAAKKSTAKM
jgi:hypothetical protein